MSSCFNPNVKGKNTNGQLTESMKQMNWEAGSISEFKATR